MMDAVHEQHFRQLETMYHSAPSQAQFVPGKLTVAAGSAELVMPIEPRYLHAAHTLHGSLYFKAMDDAAFFAAQSLVDDAFLLTASFNLHFLRPVVEGPLRSVATVKHTSRSQVIADVDLFDEATGKLVGRGSGTFMRGRTPLSAELGYG